MPNFSNDTTRQSAQFSAEERKVRRQALFNAQEKLEKLASALGGISELLETTTGTEALNLSASGRDGLSCLFRCLEYYAWDVVDLIPSHDAALDRLFDGGGNGQA